MKRILGKTGIEVSALGMGCWAIGGPWTWSDGRVMGWGDADDAESIRTIQAAIDSGITLFDTAANYGAGHSETILGRAIGSRRQQVVIATKFGFVVDEQNRVISDDEATVIDRVRQDCEDSLRRLGTDYIDVFQLHGGGYAVEKAPALRDLLETLVQEGKIRAYGWSTDDAERAAIFAAGEGCASIQMTLNVLRDAPELLAVCEQHNVASINKHPLNSGALTGKFAVGTTFPENDFRHRWDTTSEQSRALFGRIDALRDVLTSGGRTMGQGAIGWLWARSPRTIPIPGARTVTQITENAGALRHGPLSTEQMAQIESILERGAAA